MIVIAHNIRSLHNVGSIFRSCDVFGVERLYLTGITGTPPRKEIAKVALGSEHRVEWEYEKDIVGLIRRLRSDGRTILALENGVGGLPIDTCDPIGSHVLILGNELEGIGSNLLELCDVIFEIHRVGQKQSLNVSVAAGIALFALTRPTR